MNAPKVPAGPIRLSVPETELRWYRHSWLLVPLMILATSLIVEGATAVTFGFDVPPAFMLTGAGVAVFVGVLGYTFVRDELSGLCEVATLYCDRVVLVRDGRETSMQLNDVKAVRHGGYGMRYWWHPPLQLDCRRDGHDLRLYFFPRRDPEFHQWGLGSPFEALYALSGSSA